MQKVMQGTVHGRTIELEGDPQIEDGQTVEVTLRQVVRDARAPGDGFLQTEGALADDSEWDGIMEEIQQCRKQERPLEWEDA